MSTCFTRAVGFSITVGFQHDFLRKTASFSDESRQQLVVRNMPLF